jgi:sugar diacid utilization regulator
VTRALRPVRADVSWRAARDAGGPGAAAVLRYTGSRRKAWSTALAWLDRRVQQDDDLGYLTVADDADLRAVCARLELAVGPGTVRAACGPRAGDAASYQKSFAEAERLLGLADRRGDAVLPFADAGLLQLLLDTSPERLGWFVQRHLGPVLQRPDLVATLRAWLATNGSRQAVSAQLHLHRNSVGYRVGLLKTLLGVDPLHPEHAPVLHAALAAHDLLDSDART